MRLTGLDLGIVTTVRKIATGFQLGTLGFIMAHEMSHAIFTRQQTINDLVPENLNCIKKHREQICSTVNYTCEMGNGTIEEDAPDIAGLAVILDLFEEEAKNGFLLDGTPPTYSKKQFLFYVISATLCTPQVELLTVKIMRVIARP